MFSKDSLTALVSIFTSNWLDKDVVVMKYTVIIPIYNSQDYLDECILSVINQTISFKDYINIIFINDGSTDNSEKICLKYQKRFPENILYYKTENSGPSAARNKGLELTPENTDYVLFLDSDDKIAKNCIEQCEKFFLEYPDINIAVLPVFYFEKSSGPIKLNERFHQQSRIVNIFNEYNSPQFYIGGTILNYQLVKNCRFNENMSFWEDALFINQLIIQEGKYGLISNTKYFYRRRNTNDSLVDISWKNKSRYIDLIKQGYESLLKYSKNLYNYYLPYVQYLVIYHLKLFAFRKNSDALLEVLNKKERALFIETVKNLLKKIDDQYILEQNTQTLYKDFFLLLKHGDNSRLPKRNDIDKINRGQAITITKKRIGRFSFIIEGYFSDDNYILKERDKIFVKSFGKKFFARPLNPEPKIKIWDIEVQGYSFVEFSIRVPFWAVFLQFCLLANGRTIYLTKLNLFESILNKFRNLIITKFV